MARKDPEKTRQYRRDRYQRLCGDPTFMTEERKRQREWHKQKRMTDPDYRAAAVARVLAWRAKNPEKQDHIYARRWLWRTAKIRASSATNEIVEAKAAHLRAYRAAQAGEAGTAETTGSARRASTRSRRGAPK